MVKYTFFTSSMWGLNTHLYHLQHIGLRPSSKCTFESLRRTFLSYLLAIFSKLQAPHKLALHEAFYFNQASSLHQHLTPTPRSCLQRALTDPSHYISPRQQKKKGKGRFSGTAPVPDLCLLYTLYLESSKLISINDWLQVGCLCNYITRACNAHYPTR